ncbi:PAS domain-containing protein [Ramlibacter sp. XY19]|uniref:PAS domain-containing hybrid sensor histidine kinase/response regulator n=1 Tax=Ramlibacter paludis TaxID=2908000 RepID=UPI0023DB6157|nr:PAS domain-containing protein [Ramlibacter paludis]MCG2595749.1 PAS domain-containing protein [Ramlibacter paludis]
MATQLIPAESTDPSVLKEALEASGLGFWTWELASDVVTWSAESYRIHGIAPGQFALTGAAFFELVHPADRERVEATVRASLDQRKPYECEFRILRPSGEVAWVANRGRGRYAADGSPVGMIGTIADISASKLAEQAMQAALEASDSGTFHWDMRSDSLRWDAALDRLFGLQPGQAVQSLAQFIALVHPEDRAGVIARCDRCRTEGAAFEMEFRIIRPDGSERWLYDRGRTFRDPQGRPAMMTGACVDITHRKGTELALRRSEAFYRQALESLPGMTWTCDARGFVDYLSEQWQTFTGIPSERLMGENWSLALHPADRDATAARWREAVDRGLFYDFEYRVRRHDGEYRWFQARGTPIRDADGRVASWLGMAMEVHALKETQAALKETGDRFARAQRAGGVGVWELDEATGLVVWSEEVAKLLGVAEVQLDAVPAHVWRDALHPEEVARIEAGLAAAWDSGRFHEVYRVVHTDGRLVWLEAEAQVLPGSTGVGRRLAGTVRDVTERQVAEEALRTADRMKDEFLATLAHELRNPLAPLRTGLEVLRRGQPGSPVVEQARSMMERQLGHMVRLVDDLLDISRISRGHIEIRREAVEVGTIIAHAVESSRQLVESKQHALEVEIAPEVLWVEGDLTRLAQVVGNLLNNAAKYTPPGGRIRVGARRRGDQVEIYVADNGTGIAAAAQPRVFDLFMQVEGTRRHSQGGLGVGLALVRRLVELHGGTVTVQSEGVGQGSTFIVALPPAAAFARASVAPAAAADARATVPSRRVLVVDDNVDAAETMVTVLAMAGHEARVAHDGHQALEVARAFLPQVAFLDIGLPGMSGLDVARRFRADPALAGAVLVALTGWGTEDDKRTCLEAGFDLHLTKPVDADAVEQAVATWAGFQVKDAPAAAAPGAAADGVRPPP